MRKHFRSDWVCRCAPNGEFVYMEARMVSDMVNKGIRVIRCASTCARKAQKGLLLGDLCAETGHLMWALKVWKCTLQEIHVKEYNDWIDVCFHTEYVRLRDVISEGACEVIGRRIDDVERRVGLSDAHGRNSWAYRAGERWYDWFRAEKYDYGWEDFSEQVDGMFKKLMECQQREQLFADAQNENAPQPQDFFDYWSDYNPVLQENLDYESEWD